MKMLPYRFVLLLVVFALASLGLSALVERWSQAMLAGFDLAALVFMISLWPLSQDHTRAQIRRYAEANDSGRIGMLILTSLIMLVIVTAVIFELPHARHEAGRLHVWAMLLVLGSLVVAWLFANLVFALHYAHMYYRGRAEGGLNFPQHGDAHHAPDFWDFVYCSWTGGMAFATADIEIARSDIRRIAVAHAALAFFYNLIVLAFTINVTAGG